MGDITIYEIVKRMCGGSNLFCVLGKPTKKLDVSFLLGF